MTDKTISEGEANYAITLTVVKLAAETLIRQTGIDNASAILCIHQVVFDMMISTAAGPALAMCKTRVDMMKAGEANDQRAMKKAIAAHEAAFNRFWDQGAALAAKKAGGLN